MDRDGVYFVLWQRNQYPTSFFSVLSFYKFGICSDFFSQIPLGVLWTSWIRLPHGTKWVDLSVLCHFSSSGRYGWLEIDGFLRTSPSRFNISSLPSCHGWMYPRVNLQISLTDHIALGLTIFPSLPFILMVLLKMITLGAGLG